MQEIVKKFKFKTTGTVLYVPKELESKFVELGYKFFLEEREKSNKDVVVFVNNKNEFVEFLKNKLVKIEVDANLWFAYPKGTSKIKTDINRDIISEIAQEFNLATVTLISINDTWSAMRLRPTDKVGK